MGGSVRPETVNDPHGWTRRVTSFISKVTEKEHPLLEALRRAKSNDMPGHRAWADKMEDIVEDYINSEQCRSDEQMMFKYFDGTMSDEAKCKRKKTYEEIDDLVTDLHAMGYRLVKHSAITPKGNFSDKENPETVDVDEKTSVSDLFYEAEFDATEFRGLYDYFGRYQNNFPNYFKSDDDYKEYAKTHDIWVVEDIETAVPVAFSTFCISNDKADRELYGAKDDQMLLYHDTVALDSELQGKGLGMLISDVMDGYYLQTFGENIQYALCTGWINTNDRGELARGFHEKRGFGNWVEGEAPLLKWVNRYNELNEQYDGNIPPKPIWKMQKLKENSR